MQALKKPLPKVGIIALLSLLLLIPLHMISNQIAERSQRQHEVQSDIAARSAGSQRLTGPVILLEYQEHTRKTEVDAKTGEERMVWHSRQRQQRIAPQLLDIKGSTDSEVRTRGIYQARLFHLMANIHAEFSFTAPETPENGRISHMQATLLLGVSDPRGINNNPQAILNGKTAHFISLPYDRMDMPSLGIKLGSWEAGRPQAWQIEFPLNLTGTQTLDIAPVAESNRIELASDWPHPSFAGRFLPRQRDVGSDGFTARWEISHLARDFESALSRRSDEILSVSFIDPVNIYLQAERATKYGLLFVILTFAAFFLTETLRSIALHPMQYLLVGLALAIFFLLLIAFSEHMPFAAAYGIAATACIAIISWYLSGVLGKWQQGLAFGAGLTSLYGVLFGVLRSEDNALLMGSLLLFVALATSMLATRKLDWYNIRKQSA